ncbi:MAG: hypothetical protein WAM14_00200 [Candidatus Nitrosopolaris sp.]
MDILLSKTITNAKEMAKIKAAVSNIWLYDMEWGGVGNFRNIKFTIIANNINDPIATKATAFFTIRSFIVLD